MGSWGRPPGRDLKAQSEWPEEAGREQTSVQGAASTGQAGCVGGAAQGCRVSSRARVLWRPQQGLALALASPGL